MAEWHAWRDAPNALGYVRIYFKTRNAAYKPYRAHNRRLCRYWIKQERERRNALD
jgi:hypothetical protein